MSQPGNAIATVQKIPARIALLLVAITLLLTSVGFGTAHAQTPPKSGLAISPPTFELSANPGDTLKNSMRVDNITDKDLEVGVDTRNFTALGEDGEVNLSADDSPYSLAHWITVSPTRVTIAAHSSQVFDYKVAVPTNASPGGRFGSIVFKTTLVPVAGQTGVAVGQEIGALVFLKIAGKVNEMAGVASFATRSGIYDQGPVNFDIRMKNAGNVQLKPTGTITITNIFGKKIATVPIDEKNVLPGAIRKTTALWKQKWLFGRYNASLTVVYGGEHKILTTTTGFWGFPYRLFALILVAIAIVGALLYPRRKRLARAFKILFSKD